MKNYKGILTADLNSKGVIDVDTVKGCSAGMRKYPDGGCYGLCYAAKIAKFRGIDFSKSERRELNTVSQLAKIGKLIRESGEPFIRIGTMGDPCHEWDYTLSVCRLLKNCHRSIVIITKHWIPLSDNQLAAFSELPVIFNTSISALDTGKEIEHRLYQYNRIKPFSKSVLRVVTCKFDRNHDIGVQMHVLQQDLLTHDRVIDNPLRVSLSSPNVKQYGIIITGKEGSNHISVHSDQVYTGTCDKCTDKCGVNL